MVKKHLLTITRNTIRVETLPAGESEWEYRISGGVKFSLILITTKHTSSDARVSVKLIGKGSAATITGILIAKNNEKFVLQTSQVHAAPETISDLLVKTVLRDSATCVYDGGIRVEKKAQKTDAYQRNENLLLSDQAHAESKPTLEILANDVRCTHGATAGPIDESELWYLATRGIGRLAGEQLVVDGFINSAIERVEDPKIRKNLRNRFHLAV